MAKPRPESAKKIVHPHLHARLAFLQRAAQLLEEQQHSGEVGSESQHGTSKGLIDGYTSKAEAGDTARTFIPKGNSIARELSSHTTAITKKTNIRIMPDMKRTICKRCSSKLIEGQSSESKIENKSRDGRKAWANVLVVTCLSCGMEKRFPKGQQKGSRKAKRSVDCVSRPKENVVGEA